MKVKKLHVFLLSIILSLAICLPLLGFRLTTAFASTDVDVDNSASFSTDVIYQIMTDRFCDGDSSNNPTGAIYDNNQWGSSSRNNRLYHGGDWRGIINKIQDGYLTGLGVTALWISSPVENISLLDPADNSETWTSTSYHGYWAKDYFRTNPYFGTMNEFQELIDVAHANNIKIVIDFAPNHTSTTSNFDETWNTSRYPLDGALYRDGELLGTVHTDAENNYFNHEGWIEDWDSLESIQYQTMYGLADLNHMNPTIDQYMKDAADLWLDMGVDGIRVDAVKHMSFGWQKNWVSNIYENHSTFVFGEWFSGGIVPDSDMSYFANESGMSLLDFNFANATRNAIGSLSGTMYDVHNSIEGTAANFEQVNNQVTFIDNHDMSRFMTLANNSSSSVDTAYVLQLTQRGVPAIYYGSEQYLTGSADPDNRKDMPSFNKTTNAYKIISKLAPMRKSNPALAYGTYTSRWINNDVYVYERQFGDSVVLVAINRNTSSSYDITNLFTNLPAGTYQDALGGLKNGSPLTVMAGGSVPHYKLGAGVCAVWAYNAASESSPIIGSVDPLMGIVGNKVTITGRGFGNSVGTVAFGTANASVVDWSDSRITVIVPNVKAGRYAVTVTNSKGVESGAYPNFKVLTNSQVAYRFIVNNATTSWGQSVYLVGGVSELGNWTPTLAIGPMYNHTSSIAEYPTWFFDVSVPANTKIEFKYVKIDGSGNVVWESGANHIVETDSTNGQITVNWQN
ncbi:MAG: IPT/TIG domain-containing protein [Clostridia bacterium]|nr:IPT/TIG domain-containing protein [Clostridia bacterium]